MTRIAVSGLLAVLLSASVSLAQQAPSAGTATGAQNSQQDRMKACNAQAGSQKLAGDARKGFMSDCLSGKTPAAAAAPMTPQERMKTCNAQAGSQKLAGDVRKSFMSTCLKG